MNNTKFLSLVYILIACIILVFFTKGALYDFQANLDQKGTLEDTLSKQKGELEKLNTLKNKLKSGSGGQELSKYFFEFKEDEVVNYIYGYLQDTNNQSGIILIKDLSFQEGTVNEYGFKEGTINIDARVSDKASMMRFLNFCFWKDSKYSFFLKDFSYPNDGVQWPFTINIPLKVFYK